MGLREFAGGMLAVHVLWAACFVLGILALHIFDREEPGPDGQFERAIDFIIATGLGMAMAMVALFILGETGLFNAYACSIAWAFSVVVLWTLAARSSSQARLLLAVLRPLSIFRSRVAVVIYTIALVEGIPAVLPPTSFDALMYHLPNAINWAHAGRIYADPFLRAPYNAFNFELLYSLAYVYRLDRFVLFVGWLPFVCSALGVHVLTTWLVSRKILTGPAALRYGNYLGFASALAFLANPLVLNNALIGYVDVASGFFLLATAAALLRSLERFGPYAVGAAAIGGAFVGLKIQLVLFVPLVVIALLYGARGARWLSRALPALIVLAVFACPWYLHNLLATGDPLTPALNVMFGRADPIYSRVDFEGIEWNLHYGVASIFDAPLDFLLNRTPAGYLGDYGTSTSVAFIGIVPIVTVLLVIFRRRWRVSSEILLFGIIVSYGILATLEVSTKIGRYTLVYLPVLIIALGLIAVAVLDVFARRRGRIGSRSIMAGAIMAQVFLAVPEPRSADAYLPYTTSLNEVDVAASDPEAFLAKMGDAATEARDLANLVRSSKVVGNVLDIRYENAAYYFRASDVESIGDWFGPGRYSDLDAAIRTKKLPEYFKTFRLVGVLIGTRNPGWPPEDFAALVQALPKLGFVEVSFRGAEVREFLRIDVATSANEALLAESPRVRTIP
jgi:hypothetical protein